MDTFFRLFGQESGQKGKERKKGKDNVCVHLPSPGLLLAFQQFSLWWHLNDYEKNMLLLGAFSIGATGKIVDVMCQALSECSILSVTVELSQL